MATAGLMALGFAVEFALDSWRLSRPDMGFESCTSIKLPPGIIAASHTTRYTDNFLHRSHFWLLDGRPRDFRALAAAAGLERSDEAAKHMMEPDVFDGKPPEILEGYEDSLDGGRDHWLVVLYPGNRAVFQY